MKVKFFTFEQFHNKKGIGSTRIRVHNLLKYWPEASLYQYGDQFDAIVFQKVYSTQDWKWPHHLEAVKILDICDPDWLDGMQITDMTIAVDAITCPTEELAGFIRQLTDKPVVVIPDRHIVENVPEPKKHTGEGRNLVWFGYRHNAETIRDAVLSLERLGYNLTIIAEEDPTVWRWAINPEEFKERCDFISFNGETILQDLAKFDMAILPRGTRPRDRFKSNNKTTLCWLAGIPVAVNGEDLTRYQDPAERNKDAQANYRNALDNYDVQLSMKELKALISQLKEIKDASKK